MLLYSVCYIPVYLFCLLFWRHVRRKSAPKKKWTHIRTTSPFNIGMDYLLCTYSNTYNQQLNYLLSGSNGTITTTQQHVHPVFFFLYKKKCIFLTLSKYSRLERTLSPGGSLHFQCPAAIGSPRASSQSCEFMMISCKYSLKITRKTTRKYLTHLETNNATGISLYYTLV